MVTTGQSREGATAIPEGADRDVTYTQAGFRLSWELDVWGRLRRLTESARARYAATEEARRAVVTTLIADVMETYLSVRALDLELEIARRTADVAKQGLRLTRTRQERGVGDGARRSPGRAAAATSRGRGLRASNARSRRRRTR